MRNKQGFPVVTASPTPARAAFATCRRSSASARRGHLGWQRAQHRVEGVDAFPIDFAHGVPLRVEKHDAEIVHKVIVLGPEIEIEMARDVAGGWRASRQ